MKFWDPDSVNSVRISEVLIYMLLALEFHKCLVTHEFGWKVQRMGCVRPVAQLLQMSRKLYD